MPVTLLFCRFYKQAAAFCLRAVAKHSPELAQAVIDSGSLDSLVTCLEEFDPGVKEAAAWTLGYIAGHNAELAQQVGVSKCLTMLPRGQMGWQAVSICRGLPGSCCGENTGSSTWDGEAAEGCRRRSRGKASLKCLHRFSSAQLASGHAWQFLQFPDRQL
jgi:hypothetical protein